MHIIEAVASGVFVGERDWTLETTRKPRIMMYEDWVKGDNHRGVMRAADSRTPKIPRGVMILNTRMWSAVSPDDLWQIAKNYGVSYIKPEWLGANLSIRPLRSIPFSEIPRGSEIAFYNGTKLFVEAENMPCTEPGQVIAAHHKGRGFRKSDFPRYALKLRGLVGTVLEAGEITDREHATLRIFEPQFYSLGA